MFVFFLISSFFRSLSYVLMENVSDPDDDLIKEK